MATTIHNQIQQRDPFDVVKEKAQELQSKLARDFNEWKDHLENTNTANNKEFSKSQKSVRSSLKQLQAYLNDLQRTIDIVNQNRHKFPGISEEELQNRQKFVSTAKAGFKEMRSVMSSQRTKAKIEQDRSKALMSRDVTSAYERGIRDENSELLRGREQQQQLLEAKQDVVLEDMSEALSRLGDVSHTIGKELKEQEELLNEIDDEVTMAQGNMDVAMKKLEKLLGTSDRGRMCLILVLFVTACALMVLVVMGF